MALLAAAVAIYAGTVAAIPGLRPPLVTHLVAQWPLSALLHFAGGAIALVAGALQLHPGLRVRSLTTHRWTGRLYVLVVLISGCAALVLAPGSFGGPVASTGFTALAVCWLASTLNAWRHIRQRSIDEHREWMIRSYALTLAAVTLRIYLPLAQFSNWPMSVAYPAIAWLCWVPNLAVAEWWLRTRAVSFRTIDP
jgi:uncharacterized membrane protein